MRRESAIFWAALEFPELVSGRDWRCDKVEPDEVERNCHSLDNRIQMEISNAVLQALVKIAWSPLATALAGAVGGGLIAYLAAGRGERATLQEQQRRRELEFQAALRALLIEMLRGAELALSGSGAILTWADPSGKTPDELEVVAQTFEGKILFSSAKYFRDRVWSKYEDVLVENLDSATIYTVDSAYSSARQTFDFVGAPLPKGATRLNLGLRFTLWQVASEFSKAIPQILERLTEADERKRLEPRIQKMTAMLDSQSKLVN
jgi:hypothetical protein